MCARRLRPPRTPRRDPRTDPRRQVRGRIPADEAARNGRRGSAGWTRSAVPWAWGPRPPGPPAWEPRAAGPGEGGGQGFPPTGAGRGGPRPAVSGFGASEAARPAVTGPTSGPRWFHGDTPRPAGHLKIGAGAPAPAVAAPSPGTEWVELPSMPLRDGIGSVASRSSPHGRRPPAPRSASEAGRGGHLCRGRRGRPPAPGEARLVGRPLRDRCTQGEFTWETDASGGGVRSNRTRPTATRPPPPDSPTPQPAPTAPRRAPPRSWAGLGCRCRRPGPPGRAHHLRSAGRGQRMTPVVSVVSGMVDR